MSEYDPETKEQVLVYLPLGEFAKRLLLMGGLIILTLGIWQLRVILLTTFLAIIVAISLDLPVRKLQRYGLPRRLAIVLVITSAVLALIAFGVIIGTPLVQQTQNLIDGLPEAVETLVDEYNSVAQNSPFFPPIENTEQFRAENDITSGIVSTETLTGGALLVTVVGSFVISVSINFVLIIIVSIYLLVDPQTYANSVLALIPKNNQILLLRILIDLRQALASWFVTQLFSMTIIGVMIWFSLGVVWGIPNAVALGMLAGVLTFIPNFGSVIAAIPGIIFTLAERPGYLVPVLITYIVVQQLESNLITPLIVKRRLQVPAAALLVFQVMCGVLFGFMGLLLAVPMFMVIVVLVRDLYVDYLLDNTSTAIEARTSEEGETVLRVTSQHHTTQELPLKQIFNGDGPFDRSLEEVMRTISRREQEIPVDTVKRKLTPDRRKER